jgi:hypothetical protein
MHLSPSPAAQFQALKTRAALGAQLIWQALTFLLGLWIVLTTFIVWHQVGVYLPTLDHAFFGRWIVCSLLAETPFLNRFTGWMWMPLHGTYPQIGTLSAWLAGPEMYRHTFYQAVWHTAGNGWGLVADLAPLSLGGLLIMWRWRHDPATGDHLRGLRLLTPRLHNREMHGGAIARLLHGQPRGIRLGKSIIPERSECEHFLITGNPGAGKSTAMRAMLKQIAERGQAAIVIDPESEYVQEFYCEERRDWILNPLDRRCPYWSPWSELRDESFSVDAAAMAASLIRGRPRSESEKFFQDSTPHGRRSHPPCRPGSRRRRRAAQAGQPAAWRTARSAQRHTRLRAHRPRSARPGCRHSRHRNQRHQNLHPSSQTLGERSHLERARMGRESLRLDISAVARGHQRSHPPAAGTMARLPSALADDR